VVSFHEIAHRKRCFHTACAFDRRYSVLDHVLVRSICTVLMCASCLVGWCAVEEGVKVPPAATLDQCKQLLHAHFAATAATRVSCQSLQAHTRGDTPAEGLFAQTFVKSCGEWADAQHRWARGLAPSVHGEASRVSIAALPPEVRSAGTDRRGRARQRWSFYNVRLPHPELSWIATTQVAAEELDEVVRAVFEDCGLARKPSS
jgi:hypothetical protein